MADRAFREIKREVRHVPEPEKSTEMPENQQPDIIQFQRYLGNQVVQRLMKEGRLQLSGSSLLQAKLTVTPAGDQYEQEADRVAQQVVNGSQAVQRAGEEEEEALQMKRDFAQRVEEEDELQMKGDFVQRADEEDELQMKRDFAQRAEEDDELQMQRDDPGAGFEVGGDLEQSIQAQRGGGQALPDQARDFFENGFGRDFNGVRIHADYDAEVLNQSVSARAFTVGSDIFFRSGEYDPSGQTGKELIAHELTHVVQQGAAKVQKKEDD